MLKNKIEIYDKDGKFLKVYEIDSGHDRPRTLFNNVAELEGWNTTVDYIGINATIKGCDISRANESKRRSTQNDIEETKIINALVKNGIGKIVFVGRNEESFSFEEYEGKLIFNNAFLD